MNGGVGRSVTALRRWSCKDKQLPPIEHIKHIHVYDFDNTLFASPLPNKQIWNTGTCGLLQAQDFLHGGGWWHNPTILAATGQGVSVEEPRAWQGCWNQKIVDLVELSTDEEDTLCVMITGRKEDGFSDLVSRMITAKGLDFDMVCLKPNVSPMGELFSSTMHFKQILLRDIVCTYRNATDIRIYEDRPKHTKGFRDYFEELNMSFASLSVAAPDDRLPINAEVVQVSEQELSMDPVSEVSEVQRMINNHNQAILDGTAPRHAIPYKIKRSVFYTGYIISQSDTDKLKTLVKLPPNCPDHEVKHLANNILITPRPAPHSILDKVGGIGAKLSWRVTGIANLENRVWAARVEPATPGARIYTENATPCVVLATRRQAKPIEASRIRTWEPVPESQAFEFATIVGEKVLLRIEEELRNEDAYEASFPNARHARKHPREEDFPSLGSTGKPKPQMNRQAYGADTSYAGRAGGGIGFAAQRGGGRGGGRSGRGGAQNRGFHRGAGGGRGRGRGAYRSLDDSVGQGYGSGGMQY
ncbi:hypothetical protein BAUCODRAFT_30827 [Baudoinia panamericana UAMH 10762]|uniref:Swiss Army Knife RNA repair protein HAD domain-containing protein n=1 Tax=Baudoinia panamericana (strain UAMH 10762) TaxID=717646 RepID=M2NLH5_BAUPA|nr:uncharacterized protein BAUCODRAFT_30827 [Baudoinia panamericana UAMH 10762]EMD00345.1 hypothetical protein BAUCODRAFT_30827 [Baudoinia panamericana UAMH 10762]